MRNVHDQTPGGDGPRPNDAFAEDAARESIPFRDAAAVLGDRESMDRLWEENRRWVAGVLLAYMPKWADLEDLLQEVATAFVRKGHAIRDVGAVRPWLRTVAINMAHAAARSAKSRPLHAAGGEDEGPIAIAEHGAGELDGAGHAALGEAEVLAEIVADDGLPAAGAGVVARVGEAGEALEQDLQLEEGLLFLVGAEPREPRLARLLLLARDEVGIGGEGTIGAEGLGCGHARIRMAESAQST